MLDANIKAQLKSYLERVTQPIEIVASLDEGAKSREMRELLNDVVEQSALITLSASTDQANTRTPSFSMGPKAASKEGRVRFAGLPMGHEFTSLILALLQSAGYPPKVDADVIEQIQSLEGEYNFETYISLSCHNCPDVVQALNLMAILNPNIRHTMIDGALFQDEVEQRQIMAERCAQADLVITTAQVFGRTAPRILTTAMVQGMKPGSVVVDMAVESGGNVECSKPGEEVIVNDVCVLGHRNLPGHVPRVASEMYSNNLGNLVEHFWDREAKTFRLDPANDIQKHCLVTHAGGFVAPDPANGAIFAAGCAAEPLDVGRSIQHATAAALRALQVVRRVGGAEG